MSKDKKKKQKRPNIPVHTMARPRLEQILARRQHGELDDDEYVASIKALMTEMGREGVLNALVGMLDNADDARKEALMVAIPPLGDAQTIGHLWQLVRRSKLSVSVKMTALIILKQMGEEVNLEDPGEYFSWRDIKQADADEISGMARFSTRMLIKELQKIDNVDEVEAFMASFEDVMGRTDNPELGQAVIDDLVEMGDADAADLLAAFAATAIQSDVRQAARQALAELAKQQISPQSKHIKALFEEHFYAAYSSDPAHPWQQHVSILFERGKNTVQALVFLLDFGHPWQGAIKDFFPTESITPRQFQREVIDRSERESVELRRVTYTRARQFILDALEANRKNKIKLPPEFEEFRAMLERRVIDPLPETLAYAEQVDIQAPDEWGELPGQPIRGMEIIRPGGKTSPLFMPPGMLPDDFGDDEDTDEEFDFDDLLAEIDEYYAEPPEQPGSKKPDILPKEWLVNFLTSLYEQRVDPEELDEYWTDISDFLFYLDTGDNSPATLTDIQGYHLSEFLTDFWDENIEADTSIEEKDEAMQTIFELYDYLAEYSLIPQEVANRVEETADILFDADDEITRIPRSK